MKKNINYDKKTFRPCTNSENGETSDATTFYYRQVGNILTATYSGGKIKFGHLIGLVDEFGNIDMRYHQININNELMTGICKSKPEVLPNGKLRLHEIWQWTSGDNSKGTSIIEEIQPQAKVKTREEVIKNYVDSYNNFNIQKMIKDFSDDIVFVNIQNGQITMTLNGINKFKSQAETAKQFFFTENSKSIIH